MKTIYEMALLDMPPKEPAKYMNGPYVGHVMEFFLSNYDAIKGAFIILCQETKNPKVKKIVKDGLQ